MRRSIAGGVRCSAGFGSRTSAPRIRGSPPTGAGGRSTTDPARRVPAHRGPPTTAPRGDEPRRPPAGTTRSTTDLNRRVPTHRRPRPTAPRGDEPRQPRSVSRGARRARYTHADHTVSAAAPALLHARVAEHKAHLHRHHRMSGAPRISGRCQVQRRVRPSRRDRGRRDPPAERRDQLGAMARTTHAERRSGTAERPNSPTVG